MLMFFGAAIQIAKGLQPSFDEVMSGSSTIGATTRNVATTIGASATTIGTSAATIGASAITIEASTTTLEAATTTIVATTRNVYQTYTFDKTTNSAFLKTVLSLTTSQATSTPSTR